MLPTGHIATGVLLGARRSGRHPAREIAAGVAVSCLPDADILIPKALDRLGIEHRLNSGTHHSWVTHTPLFWAGILIAARTASRRPAAPPWAHDAADLLSAGIALHLLQDSVANTVALAWPVRRREYGLGLDRLAGETDHYAYLRRYPASPAGVLELGLIGAAVRRVWRIRAGR